MRGMVIALAALGGLCLGAEPIRIVRPTVQAPDALLKATGATRTELRPAGLRGLNLTTPTVAVTGTTSPDPIPDKQIMTPLADAQMQQTYLSAEGVVLGGGTLDDSVSLSQLQIYHGIIHQGMAATFASGSKSATHSMNYEAGPSPQVLAVAVFRRMAAGRHEYVFALGAKNLSGPLKDQVKLRMGSTDIPADAIFATSDDRIEVKFTFDPATEAYGSKLTVWISSSAQPIGPRMMDLGQVQLMQK